MLSMPQVHYAIVSDFYKIWEKMGYRYRFAFGEVFMETAKHRALQNLLNHRILFEKWSL